MESTSNIITQILLPQVSNASAVQGGAPVGIIITSMSVKNREKYNRSYNNYVRHCTACLFISTDYMEGVQSQQERCNSEDVKMQIEAY